MHIKVIMYFASVTDDIDEKRKSPESTDKILENFPANKD